jgi:predicted TIM-barrel enzyme/transcriptional regulator with AAA-type ATPase domain
MSEASHNPLFRRRRGRLLIGAAIGTGMAANFAMRGGADFLIALNAGRLRSMGEPSISSILALNEANGFTLDFATREILPRAEVPVIFGACAFDPRQDMPGLVARVQKAGFAGIANFPTATLLPGAVRDELERAGLGFGREIEMLSLAKAAGLTSLAYTHSVEDAEAAAQAGMDIVIIGLGWNQGGALGSADPLLSATAIEEAAIHIDRVARVVLQNAPRTICLVEGGPIVSPRHLEELCRFVNIEGYIGGSTIDRVPLESAIEDTTSAFKTVRSSSRQDKIRKVFPTQLAGRSEAIGRVRDRLLRLAEDEAPVHLQLPEPSGARPIVETLHKLGPRRSKEIFAATIGAANAEGFWEEVFGCEAGFREGSGRTRLGLLEMAHGGTLMLRSEPDAPMLRIHELLDAVQSGRGRRLGGARSYGVNARLVVVTSLAEPPIVGMSLLRLPPLAQRAEDVPSVLSSLLRDLQLRLRRKGLRLDAAAWRSLVDHAWPGDVEELRSCLEEAAQSVAGDVITQMDLHLGTAGTADAHFFGSEKDWVLDGLRRTRFSPTETPPYLGNTPKTHNNQIVRYALNHSSDES